MPVDLYVGGVEHAVLHLLYARFWHKVLFDLGVVSTPEPFPKLFNQGMILGELEFTGRDGERVARRIERREAAATGSCCATAPEITVEARAYKMARAAATSSTPTTSSRDYGADAFRLYEMFMGPLEQAKPWNTRDIVGTSPLPEPRLAATSSASEAEDGGPRAGAGRRCRLDTRARRRACTGRSRRSRDDIEALRFNTAIAALMELTNEAYKWPSDPARSGRDTSCCCSRRSRRTSPRSSGSGSATPSRWRTAPWPLDPALLETTSSRSPCR